MDRREMLGFSIRRISKVLPAILGVTTGLGSVLDFSQNDEIVEDAVCFPKAKRAQINSDVPADKE